MPDNHDDSTETVRASWLEQRLDERLPNEDSLNSLARGSSAGRLYLDYIQGSLGYLEFGDPSEYIAHLGATHVQRAQLVDVWVMPKVRQVALGRVPEGMIQGVSTVEFPIPIARVLYEIYEPMQVLLGGPGSGKSTICRYLACDLAQRHVEAAGSRPLIPVVVPVRRLELSSKRSSEESLVLAAVDSLPDMSERTKRECRSWLLDQLSNVWLILDGYDEAPVGEQGSGREGHHVDRTGLLRAILEFRARYEDARILLTSRESDYTSSPDHVLKSAFHYSVGRFGPEEVANSIGRWHSTATNLAHLTNTPLPNWKQREETLLALVTSDGDVGGLAEVPLLLNMMQVVFEPRDEFPRTISHLVDRAVRFLLVENPLRKGAVPLDSSLILDSVGQQLILIGIRKIAFRASERLLEGGGDAFSPGEIYDCLDQAALELEVSDSTGRVSSLVHHFQRGHGVIIEAEPRRFELAHNVFREVLTGQALDECSVDTLKELAEDEGWLLPLRYWAGWKAGQRGSESEAATVAHEIFQHSLTLAEPARSVAMLAVGEIVTELTRPGSALRGWAAVQALRGQVTQALIRALDHRVLPIRLRVRIGDIVGLLGDERVIAIDRSSREAVLHSVVFLPKSEVLIGRQLPHRVLRDKYLQVPAHPQVRGTVEAFWIGRYPVTNSQFAAFISSGGYSQEALWISEEGRKWVFKESDFISGLRQTVSMAAEVHYQTEILAGRLTREDLRIIAARLIERRQPLFWSDLRFNRPSQPVVGVNYWEASAYCEWVSQVIRERFEVEDCAVFLPTEFEWEYAARQGRPEPYPWGTLLDSSKPDAHVQDIKHTRVGRSCAVGSFPWACWPSGPLDIVGNVWEWTRSHPMAYSPGCVEVTPPVGSLDDRVVRGCSWLSTEPEAAEVTFRSFDPPFNAYEDLGFRIAMRGTWDVT